jgi:hypothetical protein
MESTRTEGRIGLGIAIFALLISLISLGIAYFDYKSGNRWQEEEGVWVFLKSLWGD